MKMLAALTGAVLLLGAVPAIADAAPPPPSIHVNRTTGLKGGDQVTVTARGFAPGSEVRVVQCSYLSEHPENQCSNNLAVTATANGRISTQVTLGDPVFVNQEYGDASPVYCRADVCHLFAAGYDRSGEPLALDSGELEFKGSPATITATPADELPPIQWIKVRGTAYGAEGQQVRIVQQACYDIVQETGCRWDMPKVTTRVRSDGTYSVWYLAKRIMDDGNDCVDAESIGACVLSVSVLDSAGNPDNSFGYARQGDMMTRIHFHES